MFFGPRKLPQLSRSIGKSLAEFRKASEDFKRTWEREVALESARTEIEPANSSYTDHDSVGDHNAPRQLDEPSVAAIPPEHVMARGSETQQPEFAASSTRSAGTHEPAEPESLPKREWL